VHRDKVVVKKKAKERIRKRIRKKLRGTSERPRVCVFKSNRYVYTQAFNDENGRVLVFASTLEKELSRKTRIIRKLKLARNWAASWARGSRRRISIK